MSGPVDRWRAPRYERLPRKCDGKCWAAVTLLGLAAFFLYRVIAGP